MRVIAFLSILACLLWAPLIEAAGTGEIYEWADHTGSDLIAQSDATNLKDPDERENIGDPEEKARVGDPDERQNIGDPGEEKNFNQEKF